MPYPFLTSCSDSLEVTVGYALCGCATTNLLNYLCNYRGPARIQSDPLYEMEGRYRPERHYNHNAESRNQGIGRRKP